jgi:membrane-associated phospholipid phosphatase
MCTLAGYRLGIFALISSSFFIFPRLFSGAHWLSDVGAGSLPLALIVISWARYTPIYRYYVDRMCRFAKTGNDNAKQNPLRNTL